MRWYYQPVILDDGGCTLVEVHEEDDGRPLGWCARDAPVCYDQQDLIGDLKLMYKDAKRRPVMTMKQLREVNTGVKK